MKAWTNDIRNGIFKVFSLKIIWQVKEVAAGIMEAIRSTCSSYPPFVYLYTTSTILPL